MAEMKIVYLADTDVVKFGPDATYRPILGEADGSFPIRTGIQTSQPGYEAPLHSHPYTEVLHVLEGRAEAWLEGQEAQATPLGPGDTIAISFEVAAKADCPGDDDCLNIVDVEGICGEAKVSDSDSCSTKILCESECAPCVVLDATEQDPEV